MPIDGDIVLTAGLDADDAIQVAEALTGEIRRIFEAAAGTNSSAAFKSLQVQMDSAMLKSERIREAMEELANTQFTSDEYAEYEQQLAEIEEEYARLTELRHEYEQQGQINTQEYQDLGDELQDLYEAGERVRDAMQAMQDAGTDTVMGDQTEEYQRLAEQLNQVNNRLVVLRQRALESGNSCARSARTASSEYNRLGNTVNRVNHTAFRNPFGSFIDNIVKRLTGQFKSLDSAVEDSKKNVQRFFKTFIKYAFGVRSFFYLFRKIRSAVIDGFGNLAQVSEPFNQAMSDMMNALAGLKSSFASAFAPIIQTVAPILTFFINKIADAVDAVGMLIAALTGQKQYIKYIPAQQDYAESVDKTGKNADSASKSLDKTNKSAKELKRTLAGFDDVEILHETKDDSSSSNTSPTSGSSSSKTSEVAGVTTASISDVFSNLAQLLKDAWAKADFTEVGKLVGTKINTALSNINWTKIKSTCQRIASSIATFINGFVETPGLFTNIGKTLAEVINSAFVYLYTYVSRLHWDSIGTAVKDLLVGALGNINWQLIYDTTEEFADGLAEFLNNLFKPDTFEELGTTVANMINVALIFLDDFGNKFDFVNFGESLAAGINKAVEDIKITRLISGINTLVTKLRDGIIAFLDNIEWYDLGKTLADIIKGINWRAALFGLGAIIWKAINSVIKFFRGLFDADNISTPFTDALNDLQETISTAAEKIDFETLSNGFDSLVKALTPAVEGFAKGFIDFFNVLATLGIAFFDQLGPALEQIATVINSIDPKVLEAIGTALGVIAGALVTINLVQGVIGILAGLAAPIGALAGPATAAAEALGAAGLAGAIGLVVTGLLTLEGVLVMDTTVIDDEKEELESMQGPYGVWADLVRSVGDEYGLTEEEMLELYATIIKTKDPLADTNEIYSELDTTLQNAGVDVDSFKGSLSDAASVAATQGRDISAIEGYIDGVGTTAADATEDTSGLAGVFDAFNGLSITAPLKFLLLQGAIKALGDSGKLSDEDVANLYTTLDEWKADPTEENMGKVQTAFENTGISAKDFTGSVVTSMSTMPGTVQSAVSSSVNTIVNAADDLESGAKESFTKVGEGATKGLEDQHDDVIKAAGNLVSGSFDEMDKQADSHSPSKEAIKRGEYIGEGLQIGVENRRSYILQAVDSLIDEIKNRISDSIKLFSPLGEELMTEFKNGITSGYSDLIYIASEIVSSMYDTFNDADFWSVGKNIAVGIYNGLADHGQWLQTLAWNTAVEMYNSACRALDIHSPSRKFEYIGDMVGAGLANGVENSQSAVTDAMSETINAMVDEAESNSPDIHVDASIDTFTGGLDDTLTTFSDKIVDSFSALVDTLQRLGNGVTYTIPPVAQGRVVPYGSTISTQNEDVVDRLAQQIGELQSNGISLEELRAMMVEMFTQYMNIDFTIGDEQIARHANAGNARLNRRYNPITN